MRGRNSATSWIKGDMTIEVNGYREKIFFRDSMSRLRWRARCEVVGHLKYIYLVHKKNVV